MAAENRAIAALLMTVVTALAPFARADEARDLYEENSISMGYSYQLGPLMQTSLEPPLPFPGVKDAILNAAHVDLTLTMSLPERDGPNIAKGRVDLVRWPNLHLLGLERDYAHGSAYHLLLVGVYVPRVLWGELGSPSWGILKVGGELGVDWRREDFGARKDGYAVESIVACQFDTSTELSENWSLRAFGEVTYHLGVGSNKGEPGIHYSHLLTLEGGSSLYYDFTSEPRFTLVPRTNSATGKVTYRKKVNPGARSSWKVLSIDAQMNAVDTVTKQFSDVEITTGLRIRF